MPAARISADLMLRIELWHPLSCERICPSPWDGVAERPGESQHGLLHALAAAAAGFCGETVSEGNGRATQPCVCDIVRRCDDTCLTTSEVL